MAKEKTRVGRLSKPDIGAPLMEITGNRRVCVEGSTGVLLYENEFIKIAAGRMMISFGGRGLRLRCVSGSCVEIEGFISKIEFLT